MTGTSKIILTIVLAAVLTIGIGYAAIKNITLEITGQLAAAPSDANFTVKFTDASPSEGNVVANVTGDKTATLNVSGLTAKGEKATATYTIQNTSEDLTAKLSAITSNTNTEYFDVTYSFESTSLKKGAATTVTVTIELVKTPIQDTVSSTVGINIEASPVQPQ